MSPILWVSPRVPVSGCMCRGGGLSLSLSLYCISVCLRVMYLSVSVSLHPSVSVDFCLYLSVSFLSVYEYLSLFSARLICVSLGLSCLSGSVSPPPSVPLLRWNIVQPGLLNLIISQNICL